jgi:hypothetical protein
MFPSSCHSYPEVIEFEGYKFSRLGRFVSLLVPMNTLVLISLFVARTMEHT